MKVVRYFLREYPGQSLIVLACLLAAGGMEGVGLGALLPVLSLVAPTTNAAGGASEPSFLERTVNGVMEHLGIEPGLGELLAFLVIVFWLKALLVLFAKRKVGYTVARVATDLRLALLRALMAARWSHFTRLPAGKAANALATEAERGSLAYHHMCQVAGYAVEATLYVALALAVSWKVTLGAVGTAAVTIGSLDALVRMSSRAGGKQTRSLKSLLSRLTDSLQATKMLKGTGREELIGPLLEHDTQRLNAALRRRVFSKEALRALQEPIIFTAGAGGVFVAITLLGLPLGETLLLTGLFLRTISSSNKMQRKYQEMVTEATALTSVREMIDHAEAEIEYTLGSGAPSLDVGVELRAVKLRFDHNEVLRDFSIEIPAGRITALIGDSGSGKTTASDLVLGLVRPDAGEVLIDGVPLQQLDLRCWRHMIGYVPQELPMLHDTVERNVSLGDPDLSSQDVERALREAGAWSFVSALPDGMQTSVGERGMLLSGGQRQRIAIARALVHGAQLLILDEATAALDPESEAVVWAAVEQLRGRTTVLAISHQPALAGIADRIYRVVNGRATLVQRQAEKGERVAG